MSASVVGALRVNLGLDSAQFANGLKGAQGALANFGDLAARGFAAAAAGATLAAAAIAVGLRSVVNEADEMGKAAQKVGLTVEELSGLAYTAGLAGIEFNELQSGLVKLTKAMSDVASGAGGDAKLAFDALGISVKNADGTMKSSALVMSEIAEKFSGYKDGAEKTALALAIFGRAGAGMIPMLNQGAAAIADANAEAKLFGVTISSGLARDSEILNDNMSRLGSAARGMFVAISGQLVPILAEWSTQLVQLAKELNLFETVGRAAAAVIQTIAEWAAMASSNFQAAGVSLAAWGKAIDEIKSLNFSGAFNTLSKAKDDIEKIGNAMDATIARLRAAKANRDAFGTLDLNAFGTQKPNAPGIVKPPEVSFAGPTAEMKKFERELERFREKLRTPYEELQVQLNKIDEYFLTGRLGAEEYGRAVEQAQQKFRDQAIQSSALAQTLQSNLSGIFDSIISGTFNARQALAKLAADLAKMLANKLIKDLVGSLFGSIGGGSEGGIGGFIAGLFGGAKATGGPVSANRAYLVGEQGPELMVPNTSGSIISARDLSRGGSGAPIPIQITVSPTGEFDARVGQIADSRAIVAVRTGISEYDRNVAPTTMRRIDGDPRRIG
jgi:putative NIF3 family GTP cyclohydrolase 1 type 2